MKTKKMQCTFRRIKRAIYSGLLFILLENQGVCAAQIADNIASGPEHSAYANVPSVNSINKAVNSDLALSLSGVILKDKIEDSVALIEVADSEAKAFKIGVLIKEKVHLIAVEADRVLINNDGNIEQLKLNAKAAAKNDAATEASEIESSDPLKMDELPWEDRLLDGVPFDKEKMAAADKAFENLVLPPPPSNLTAENVDEINQQLRLEKDMTVEEVQATLPPPAIAR